MGPAPQAHSHTEWLRFTLAILNRTDSQADPPPSMRTDRTSAHRPPHLPRGAERDRPTQAAHTTAAINPSRMTHRTHSSAGLRAHAFWGRAAFGDRGPFRVPFVFSTPRSAPRTRRVTRVMRRRRQRDDTPARPAHSTVGRGRPVGSVVKSVAVFPTRFDRVIEAQCSERMYRYIL